MPEKMFRPDDRMTCMGHRLAASCDKPDYVFQRTRTGARAAHKPSELKTA
nr:DUF2945 domain-containing protein [uncultured Brevundimonas sp.]